MEGNTVMKRRELKEMLLEETAFDKEEIDGMSDYELLSAWLFHRQSQANVSLDQMIEADEIVDVLAAFGIQKKW